MSAYNRCGCDDWRKIHCRKALYATVGRPAGYSRYCAGSLFSCISTLDERNRRDGRLVSYEPRHVHTDAFSHDSNTARYRDKLWLHNSGTGEFGAVEIDSGHFEPVAFAPGGLLKPRDNKTFSGLSLEERSGREKRQSKMRFSDHKFEHRRYCQWVKIEGVVEEL